MSILKTNLPAIKAAVEKIFQDPELKREVTYKKFLSETFSNTLGYNVETYTDLEVTGCKFRSTAKTAAVQTGSIQVGDPVFLFRISDLGYGLSLKDQIQDQDGSIFKVKEIIPLHGICNEITVESGGLSKDET